MLGGNGQLVGVPRLPNAGGGRPSMDASRLYMELVWNKQAPFFGATAIFEKLVRSGGGFHYVTK